MELHRIPYKPLSACGLDELAAEVAAKRQRAIVGGVAFARKEEQDEKSLARRKVIDLLTIRRFPRKISILSMPGLKWVFEAQLLARREPLWRERNWLAKTRFTCVENDRFVYYSATMQLPGRSQSYVKYLDRPPYAECMIGQRIIKRYIFANVDDLIQDTNECFDVAWLDYTGPLTVERMTIIERFWSDRVRGILVVTSLKARWNSQTSRTIAKHGSCLEWIRSRLPGHVYHTLEYQDGHSPMVQFAVGKKSS